MEQGPYHQQTRIAASDNVRNGLARVLNLSLCATLSGTPLSD